jgi:hypothetical protein
MTGALLLACTSTGKDVGGAAPTSTTTVAPKSSYTTPSGGLYAKSPVPTSPPDTDFATFSRYAEPAPEALTRFDDLLSKWGEASANPTLTAAEAAALTRAEYRQRIIRSARGCDPFVAALKAERWPSDAQDEIDFYRSLVAEECAYRNAVVARFDDPSVVVPELSQRYQLNIVTAQVAVRDVLDTRVD